MNLEDRVKVLEDKMAWLNKYAKYTEYLSDKYVFLANQLYLMYKLMSSSYEFISVKTLNEKDDALKEFKDKIGVLMCMVHEHHFEKMEYLKKHHPEEFNDENPDYKPKESIDEA